MKKRLERDLASLAAKKGCIDRIESGNLTLTEKALCMACRAARRPWADFIKSARKTVHGK